MSPRKLCVVRQPEPGGDQGDGLGGSARDRVRGTGRAGLSERFCQMTTAPPKSPSRARPRTGPDQLSLFSSDLLVINHRQSRETTSMPLATHPSRRTVLRGMAASGLAVSIAPSLARQADRGRDPPAERRLRLHRRPRLGRARLLRQHLQRDAAHRPAGPRGHALHQRVRRRAALLADPRRPGERALPGAHRDHRLPPRGGRRRATSTSPPTSPPCPTSSARSATPPA